MHDIDSVSRYVFLSNSTAIFCRCSRYLKRICTRNMCSDHTRGAATCGFRGYIDLAGRLKLDYYLQTGG